MLFRSTLVGQRVFGIALGYEDLNDHDELRHDPLMGVLAGKLAARREDCAPVAGKSTLICRISARRSAPTFGRAPRERDFQRQYLFIPRTPRDQSASAFLLSTGTRLACISHTN